MEARDCDLNRVNPTLLNLITILTDLCCSAEYLLKSCFDRQFILSTHSSHLEDLQS